MRKYDSEHLSNSDLDQEEKQPPLSPPQSPPPPPQLTSFSNEDSQLPCPPISVPPWEKDGGGDLV